MARGLRGNREPVQSRVSRGPRWDQNHRPAVHVASRASPAPLKGLVVQSETNANHAVVVRVDGLAPPVAIAGAEVEVLTRWVHHHIPNSTKLLKEQDRFVDDLRAAGHVEKNPVNMPGV